MGERTCGACSMCCKLPPIEELQKPAGVWCPHVVLGKGCGVYETRPVSCRNFNCSWLLKPGLDDSWRPDRAGFLLRTVNGTAMLVDVEPSKPDAWKKKPYYAQLKAWSQKARAGEAMVLVKVRDDFTAVLPNADLPIGQVAASDRITIGCQRTGPQEQWWVDVARADGSVTRYDA